MAGRMKDLVLGEEGQGMTEYGLVVGTIAFAVVGILTVMRGKIEGLYEDTKNKFLSFLP